MSEKAERRKANKTLKQEKALRDSVITELLNRPDGRKFLWWLLQVSKFNVPAFAADPYITAFQCGEANIGQQMFDAIIEANPAGFLRMQQEINDARTSEPDPYAGGDTSSSSADPYADSRASSDSFPDSDPGDAEGA